MNESGVTQQTIPWYRLPIVWFVIAVPLSAVLFGMFMLWLAVSSNDGLVEDDYYKQGLAINQNLQRDQNALEYGVTANAILDNDNRVLRLDFNKGALSDYPAVMVLKCLHSTRAGMDVTVELHHGIGDQYIGNLRIPLAAGVWNLQLSAADWRLQQRVRVTEQDRFDLQFGGNS